MRKIVLFLSGLMLLVVTGAALLVASVIYDAGDKMVVEPYFFQPNNLSTRRPGVPARPEDLGDMRVMELLIHKFVAEYFYTMPDAAGVAARVAGNTPLRYLASPSVFNDWTRGEAQTIMELARSNVMRTARVVGDILKPMGSDYWTVEYELRTWETPNDMSAAPVVTRGRMYLNVLYRPGVREPISRTHRYLEAGGDPSAVFQFQVVALVME